MSARLLAALLALAAATQAVAADLHDPMRPPNAPAATGRTGAPSSLQLQAVIGSGPSRVAIVNGKVVHIGDKVDGAIINDISATAVHYTRGGKQLIASLPNTKLDVRANNTLQAGQP
jgi:opacity protein-like surface antigen